MNTLVVQMLDPSRTFVRCAGFLFVLIVTFSLLSSHFFSSSNLENILSASSVIGLLAFGSTFVIASGGIDLSVASVMAFSGTACAFIIGDTSNFSPILALAICAFVGFICGAITGCLINLTKAPSFIVTLGMLSVARAAAFIVSDGTPIYGLPEALLKWGQGNIFGLSSPVAILFFVGIFTHILLHRTRFGSRVLTFGDNPMAAEAMGVKLDMLRLQLFSLSGLLSGVAGFVFMARTNAGDPTAGQNYELIAVTAVVLGGSKLFGGQATILGTFLGVSCLGVLQNGLNLLAVSTYYQVLFVGVVLICAAFFDRIGKSK